MLPVLRVALCWLRPAADKRIDAGRQGVAVLPGDRFPQRRQAGRLVQGRGQAPDRGGELGGVRGAGPVTRRRIRGGQRGGGGVRGDGRVCGTGKVGVPKRGEHSDRESGPAQAHRSP